MSDQLTVSIRQLAIFSALTFLDGLVAKGYDVTIEQNGFRVLTVQIWANDKVLGEGERLHDALLDLVGRQALAEI